MRTLQGWLLGLLCAAGLPAQDEDAAALLERAKTVEEHEHDYRAAIELYREAAAGGLAEAWLRLGTALRRIGRPEQARAAWQKAVALGGPHAARAKALLEGGPQDRDDVLEARALEAISRLRKNGAAKDELLWLGRPAVPYLVKAVEGERVNLGFIRRATDVLLTLDGPETARWLRRVQQRGEALVERAVLDGVPPQPETLPEEIQAALLGFLRDEDPTVRTDAAESLARIAPATELTAMAGDPHAGVRNAVLAVLARQWSALRHDRGERASMQRLIPHLRRALDDVDSRLGFTAMRFLGNRVLYRSAAGRELFLEALTRPAFAKAPANAADLGHIGPTEHLEEVLEVARALGRIERSGSSRKGYDRRHVALASFVQECLQSWRQEATGGVLELVSLGYGLLSRQVARQVGSWIRTYAPAGAVVAVAERLDRFQRPDRLFPWMIDKGVPAAALEPLRRWMEREGFSDDALAAVGAIDGEESARYLVQLAGERPGIYGGVATALARGRSAPTRAAMRRALALGTTGPVAANRRWRDVLFRRLVELGDREAIGVFPKAYELGLRGRRGVRGLRWLAEFESAYEPADVARIVDKVLATGSADAWYDVVRVVRDLPEPARAVVCRRALECPAAHDQKALRRALLGELMRLPAAQPGRAEMVARVLREGTDDDRLGVLSRLDARSLTPEIVGVLGDLLRHDDTTVVAAAVRKLAGAADRERVTAMLRPLLRHASSYVRRHVASALAEIAPARAFDWMLPLLEDPDAGIRRRACAFFERRLDRRAVPALLAAMRDPDENVREAAKQALAAIEFYEETERRWKRIMEGAGLDEASAAEALVKQARSEDQRVRLAAIASLGTLGDPRTLPFLIELMQDEDAEVAGAAAAAVQKINRGR